MPRAGFLFVATRGYSSLQGGAAPVAEPRLRVCGFQQLQLAGLVAPWHVGFSRTRNQTCVPCNGRQILIHCTTREVHLETTLEKRIIPWQRYFPLIQWRCKMAWSKSSWVCMKTWVMRKARIRPQSFKEKHRLCTPDCMCLGGEGLDVLGQNLMFFSLVPILLTLNTLSFR